ncbi:MAG TPA: efflux RND transporter periplasmic adaptor subunit, partial [bacterium]|nr:efflux RND transporter periplasmic adaptor subunit [bacterium]
MKKKSLFIVLAALFLLFLLWRIAVLIFGGSDNAKRGSGQLPVAVETDSVRYEPIEEIRQFTGSVYPIYQYILAPKVSGRLLSIRKRIGDWVRAGEVVAVIDDAEYQQALREAEANLKIAEASLIEAQSQAILAAQELERVRLLKEKGIAAQAEFDVASSNEVARKSRLELAQAQVEQRQAALKSAQIRLNYTRLTASEPGFIGERFVDEGALLSVNSAVVSVVGIDRVIVRTTIV